MGQETRHRVLHATSALVRRQGYAGTGLKEIATEAEAPWSSLYHFFPGGKEQIVTEAILFAAGRFEPTIRRIFTRADGPGAAARSFFELAAAALEASDYADGCPVATAALEAASTSEPVRAAASDAFEMWASWATSALGERGVDPEAARRITTFALAALEGAILLSRVHRSTAPLREAGAVVEQAVSALEATAGR